MSTRIISRIRSKLLASPSRVFYGPNDSLTRADRKVIAKMRANDDYWPDYLKALITGIRKGLGSKS